MKPEVERARRAQAKRAEKRRLYVEALRANSTPKLRTIGSRAAELNATVEERKAARETDWQAVIRAEAEAKAQES